MVRFVNSGTEATMTAIRLARGFTKRKKVLKFAGNYHGAHDYVLIDAGSAVAEYSVFTSDGIPEEIKNTVEVCEYNDLSCVEKKLRSEEFAAVIVEPVAGNMGVVLPDDGFLQGLREVTKTYGTVLIFDEVITGFRLGLSGAQGHFRVIPDLTTLGKIIGGGLPIGAITGKREIMSYLTPGGKVFNAGTFNANPLSMAAGLATIEVLETNPKAYETANKAIDILAEAVERGLKGRTYAINRIASMMQFFLGVKEVRNSQQAKQAKKEAFLKFHEEGRKKGVFVAPSQFEAIFTSSAHLEEVMKEYSDAVYRTLVELTW
jgi:glutamate-1-semialdehyde 2,1-aminomutase